MKAAITLIFAFVLLFPRPSFGQGQTLMFPLLLPEGQTNIIVLADLDHPIPCPPQLTNLISNTNLISVAERKQLEQIEQKYGNLASNSAPSNGVFEHWALKKWGHADLIGSTDSFWVACFSYDNPPGHEEIRWNADCTEIKFRTSTGDGYDTVFVKHSMTYYEAYKKGALGGLFLGWHDPNHPDNDPHFGMWARFENGKAVGEMIVWRLFTDPTGKEEFKIAAEARFKKPFDFLKYQSIPIDLDWEVVPTNVSNSLQNPPKPVQAAK